MSTTPVVKHLRNINVAVADEDIAAVDAVLTAVRRKVPFRLSRSEFGRVSLRFTIASLIAGHVTMESLANDCADIPDVADFNALEA